MVIGELELFEIKFDQVRKIVKSKNIFKTSYHKICKFICYFYKQFIYCIIRNISLCFQNILR